MHEFKTYHPLVNFIYFALVIGFSCFLLHPVCLAMSLICGVVFLVMQKSKGMLLWILPMLVLTALLNPLFNHQGITILAYLPDGNPLTLESVIYGVCAGAMVASVICYFTFFHNIMTSDKFLCLFGKLIPSLSLIFSMTLRFVPTFIAEFKRVSDVQKHLVSQSRTKHALSVFSIVTTHALEHAVETADSMKARGYGLSGRTSFSPMTFDARDKKTLLWLVFLGGYTLIGMLSGALAFDCFPYVHWSGLSLYSASVLLSYLLLLIHPIIIELWEVRKWESFKSNI